MHPAGSIPTGETLDIPSDVIQDIDRPITPVTYVYTQMPLAPIQHNVQPLLRTPEPWVIAQVPEDMMAEEEAVTRGRRDLKQICESLD